MMWPSAISTFAGADHLFLQRVNRLGIGPFPEPVRHAFIIAADDQRFFRHAALPINVCAVVPCLLKKMPKMGADVGMRSRA